MASKKKSCKHEWSKWGVPTYTHWFGHGRCSKSHRVCAKCRKIEWKKVEV